MHSGSRNRSIASSLVGLAALAMLLAPASAFAGKPTVDFEFSGQYRIRFEGHYNRDLDSDAEDRSNPFLQRVRLGVKADLNDNVEFFIQVQDARAWGDEASTASNEANLDLHQGYVRLMPSEDFELTAGRQKWSYGDQRLVGGLEWANVARAFDGVHGHKSWENSWLDGFWGRIARFTEPESDEASRDLFGAYSHFDVAEDHVLEPYLLAYRAGDESPSEIEEEFGKSHVIAFGGHYAAKLDQAKLTGEFAYETGSMGGDDLSAAAVALTGSYRFGDVDFWVKPLGGYDFATGDEDPTDGKREEFFNFFPTNHMHYGYIDFFGWRNINSPWGGVALGGHGHTVLFKVHAFWLHQKRGRWSSAGGSTLGFDPEGESGSKVGNEIDITWKKKVYKLVKLHAGYAYFSPGEFAKATRGEDAAHFVYFETTVTF